MKCPFCNQEVEDGSKVCTACGRALTEMPAAEQVPEAEQTPAEEQAPAEAKESETQKESEFQAPSEPKKSKKWVAPAAVAAVAAVAAGAYMAMNQVDPKDAVIDAFKSIVAEDQVNPAEELFGISALMEKLNTESSEVAFNLTFEGTSDPDLAMLESGSVGATAYNDLENMKFGMDLNIGYADMDLVNMLFYLDETQVAAAIPELSSKTFMLNYGEDLEGQLAASPYLGALISQSGVDLTGLNAYLDKYMELVQNNEQIFDVEALWNRYKEGSRAIDDLKASMTAEKIEKRDFTIDGANVSCKGYHATVTKDALIQFMNTTKEFFLSDETLKNDMISYMGMVAELQGTMAMLEDLSMQSPEEMQQQMWQEAETSVDALIEAMDAYMGDVAMNVYVTKDGKMAGFDFETTLTTEAAAAEGAEDGAEAETEAAEAEAAETESEAAEDGTAAETVKVTGSVSFAGGYNMLANVDAAVNLENSNGEAVTFTVNKSGSYEAGKSHTASLTSTMESGEESFTLNYDGSYLAEDGTYELSLDLLEGEESQMKITSGGYFENVVKGESFDLYIDSLKIETPVLTGGNDYLEFSGSYQAGPLTAAVEIPEGEAFDLLAGTEADYQAVLTELSGNVFALMMQLYQ